MIKNVELKKKFVLLMVESNANCTEQSAVIIGL